MRRRAAVAGLLMAVIAGCGGSSDATGPRAPPNSEEPPPSPGDRVVVSDIEPREGPDGRLEVVATVNNAGPVAVEATVAVTAVVDGSRSVERVKVRVPAGGSMIAEATFAVRFDQYTADGALTAVVERTTSVGG